MSEKELTNAKDEYIYYSLSLTKHRFTTGQFSESLIESFCSLFNECEWRLSSKNYFKCIPKEGSKLPTVQFYIADFQHFGQKTVYEEENSYLLETEFSKRLLANTEHTPLYSFSFLVNYK